MPIPSEIWARIERRLDIVEQRLLSLEISSEHRLIYVEKLKDMVVEFKELRKEVRALQEEYDNDLHARDRAEIERRKMIERDRKTTRRWLIGSAIAASGVMVAAAAVIIALIQKGPS